MVFLLEFIMKTIAYGFVLNGPHSYLRDAWNITDFCIVVFSMASLFPFINSLQVFKMFRVARVLRLISASKTLRIGA